jgi:hypothetical protein
MKHLLLVYRRARFFMLALGVLGLLITGVSMWRSSALKAEKQAEATRRFYERIRDGVGREVQFASPGEPSGKIRDSVNSVDQFIFKRSGVKLSGDAKNRLSEMEYRALNGTNQRITVSELSDILSAIAFERLSTLSDQEISHIDDSLRGLNDPQLPESFQRGRKSHIKLRASKISILNSEQFVEQVKAIKHQVGTPAGLVFYGMARNTITAEVKEKTRLFAEVTPEKFPLIWDLSNDSEATPGMTPLQAVLLTYSVASDDHLADSETNLKKYMTALQRARVAKLGQFPTEEGRFAFGVYGFIYSSPIDLVFDEATMTSLLNRIEERMAS